LFKQSGEGANKHAFPAFYLSEQQVEAVGYNLGLTRWKTQKRKGP
jgi:hypothetical protein